MNTSNISSLRTSLFKLPLDPKGVKKSLKFKYQSLTDWKQLNLTSRYKKKKMSFTEDLFSSRKKQRPIKSRDNRRSQGTTLIPTDFNLDMEQIKKSSKKKIKNISSVNDDIEIKLKKRERLKKDSNPIDILKHYIANEHLQLSQQKNKLIELLFRSHNNIQKNIRNNDLLEALKIIYQILTISVDFNQMHYFCLIINLIAQICYFMEDYNRSFYFYQQSRLASTHNNKHQLKIDALIGMAQNANNLQLNNQALIFLKKALQYAWHIGNKQKQLRIYDLMGLNYYYLGNLHMANYFHQRFTLGAYQSPDSAIKLISNQILNQFNFYFVSLQKENLTSLFLEYLRLPIHGINQLPVQATKSYVNYGNQGESPRRKRNLSWFQKLQFEGKKMIKKLLQQERQFLSQIPNPTLKDLSQNYSIKYKKKSRIKDYNIFQKTPFYQKHFNKKLQYDHNLNNISLYKFPLDNLIQNRINDKQEDKLSKIYENLSRKKIQIHQRIKDQIMTKHLNKQIQRDENELKNQRTRYLNQSFNALILDYVDPLENYKKK